MSGHGPANTGAGRTSKRNEAAVLHSHDGFRILKAAPTSNRSAPLTKT